MLSDAEIAKKVQSGDAEAFGFLVEKYEAKIFRYGHKFLVQRQDIEDIVQEVFLKAYSNIQSYDTGRKFSSWIYRIAHNEFINRLKSPTQRLVSYFDFDTFFPHPYAKEITEQTLDEQEIKKITDECLETIELKYREPVVLFFLEGMSYKEISDILQIPVSTVGVRIKRARDQMRENCQKYKKLL